MAIDQGTFVYTVCRKYAEIPASPTSGSQFGYEIRLVTLIVTGSLYCVMFTLLPSELSGLIHVTATCRVCVPFCKYAVSMSNCHTVFVGEPNTPPSPGYLLPSMISAAH